MKNPIKDKKFVIGLVLYAITLLIFGGSFIIVDYTFDDDFSLPFLLNFMIFWIYLLVIWERKRRFSNRNRNILLLLIANVSAYSLNRFMPIFSVSTNWLATYLLILNGAMLLYCFRKVLPVWVEYSLPAIFCSGILFSLYQCIYLAPFYPFSLLVCWFFLIPFHILVPLWWLILLIKIIRPYLAQGKDFLTSIIIGCTIPLCLVIGFSIQWYRINEQVKTIYEQSSIPLDERELPTWVELSRVLDNDWLSQKILKSRLVYSIPTWNNLDLIPDNSLRLNERKKHDPLVVIAALFSKPLELNKNEQIQLLKAVFDQRHQTEQKLWTGENLSTKQIETTIQFFPAHRLAYTEKIIHITNNKPPTRGGNNQQEALYTFYMPEGAVVTSASLWVEGVERPSFLTTRNKADNAYKAIVGRERRDPLLLHWQEGNRVTVRVFPVTPKEDRQFKIGITSPLREKKGQLIYQNTDFKGPYWETATEHIRILGAADKLDFLSQLAFKSNGSEWSYKGKYHSDWNLKIDAPELANTIFSFDGQHFQMNPYYPVTTAFEAKEIYLDINKSWTKRQFNKIWTQVKYQEVYVYKDRMIRLTEENKDRLFGELRGYHFNLFPFYAIRSPQNALVITQGDKLTPVLSDLKGSPFSEKLNYFLNQDLQPVAVFDLGERPSLYLKSIKELRGIHYHAGELKQLLDFLDRQIFIKNIENEHLVALPEMGISIQQVANNPNQSTAPDHLMRLFSYNDLMKKIGRDYFKKEQLATALVAQAEKAFVVSPVSSLIVLETQADYDRFDIKESKNSLKNASINDAGSVPEPKEWLLIILSLLVAITLWRKLQV